MNRSLLITLFGLALAIGWASSFNDDEDLANIAAMKEATNDYDLEDAVSDLDWNGEDDDKDEDENDIDALSPLSNPVKQSSDPKAFLPFIRAFRGARRLIRRFRRRRSRRRRSRRRSRRSRRRRRRFGK